MCRHAFIDWLGRVMSRQRVRYMIEERIDDPLDVTPIQVWSFGMNFPN
jgi:hypothetical protein